MRWPVRIVATSSATAALRAPLDDPVEMGALLENLVAATLHSLATQAGLRLFNWRAGRDEVDLVLDDPNGPLAFEVASSPRRRRTGRTAASAASRWARHLAAAASAAARWSSGQPRPRRSW